MMQSSLGSRLGTGVLIAVFAWAGVGASAADRAGKGKDLAAVEAAQPAVESLDLQMYGRIREEGLEHSHIMEYASALSDDIGPRLTGSPNLAKANAWTRDQLTAMGCVNAHLEDWGEFGMGWQQLNTWARMVTPDTAVFVAQATPWSPATMVDGKPGPVSGPAVLVNIQDEADFAKYKGKLSGKIVFLGEMREAPPLEKALFSRYTEKELQEMEDHASGGGNYSPGARRTRRGWRHI